MGEKNLLKKRWKLIINYLTIVALIILAIALRHQLAQTFDNLKHVNATWLLLMIPIQAWNYYAQSRLFQSIFSLLGSKLKATRLYVLSLELNFVNNVFPSGGVSGASYFAARVRSADITLGRATFTYVMKLAMIFVSFQFLVLLGLFMLAIHGNANQFVIFVASFSSAIIIAGIFLFIYIIGSQNRITSTFTYLTRILNRIVRIVLPKHPEVINLEKAKEVFVDFHHNYNILKSKKKELKTPLYYGFLNNISELLSIYVVYLAFGHWVNPGAIILAYAIANFAGLIAVLPGGIGVYEAMMVAVMVAAGIPANLSLSVTIMYRVLNTLIQLPPGYFLWNRRSKFDVGGSLDGAS